MKEFDLDLELEKIAKKLQPVAKTDDAEYNTAGGSCATSGGCPSE
ncbi:MAG TPA: hypothetical protein VFV50_01680 [Bdellovibrionales bacterium]|nr:hypothetical protein [Bdellovibrionales bacterium]